MTNFQRHWLCQTLQTETALCRIASKSYLVEGFHLHAVAGWMNKSHKWLQFWQKAPLPKLSLKPTGSVDAIWADVQKKKGCCSCSLLPHPNLNHETTCNRKNDWHPGTKTSILLTYHCSICCVLNVLWCLIHVQNVCIETSRNARLMELMCTMKT